MPQVIEPRSERGRRRYAEQVLTPLDQIRMQPNGVTGAWAYFLRSDGATIRDALILAPNGGAPPAADDPKGKFGTNASYFRERAQAKGLTYLGQRLDTRAVRLLVETLAKNRGDELLFVEDEIAEQDNILANAESAREREIAHKRKRQYQVRLDTLNQPFDPDALVAELDEISRAQRLANIDPNVLAVMREMVGEVNEKFAGMVTRFSTGKTSIDPEMAPTGVRTRRARGGAAASESFAGVDFIDADN